MPAPLARFWRRLTGVERHVLLTRLTPDECHDRLWPKYRVEPFGPVLPSGKARPFPRGAEAIALARGRERGPVAGSAGTARFRFFRNGLSCSRLIEGRYQPSADGTRTEIELRPRLPGASPQSPLGSAAAGPSGLRSVTSATASASRSTASSSGPVPAAAAVGAEFAGFDRRLIRFDATTRARATRLRSAEPAELVNCNPLRHQDSNHHARVASTASA